MNLYEKLAKIENKLSLVEEKLGVPQRRYLLVRHTITDPTTRIPSIEDTLINPKAYITSVSPRFVNMQIAIPGADSIYVTVNDLEVEIPKVYPITLFKPEGKTRAMFILDPTVTYGTIVYSNPATKSFNNPKIYSLVYVDDTQSTVYKLILTGQKDKK
ncbi:hypothetical protein [Nostoc sp. 'Peltigera membranacea cyanobiont' N6]|uniref:hypothetical protein n=1 Tax=Nostoc sp. 'Peltigera membranacea cyanobiont' N6 TaxID=1261031 RepID=UPI000CF30CCF|nr:hypothetical protein [Nostoc sp. 'Peltigera membranacea cyanobiont' N6]AVH67036.1 hypothetical protein NPM_5604 [Nostoc sp. 'Peltigera membranacea cyanobiont' N6]